jgi:predicted acylesterase/phospholipase RssA
MPNDAAGAESGDGTSTFETIFKEELKVVNFRREQIKAGTVAEARRRSADPSAADPIERAAEPLNRSRFLSPHRGEAALAAADSAENRARNRPANENVARAADWDTVRLKSNSNLTGLALSGGGIRSAAFCLGALQALDSLTDDPEPNVIDAVDYLSTVSGGGYIGTSLVAALTVDPAFPFDSRLDEQESPDMQHLRDYSNFLAPNGTIDYLTSFALVLRGLLVNAVIVFPALLFLAAATIYAYPLIIKLQPPLLLTLGAAVAGALFMIGSALLRPFLMRSRLGFRENFGYFLGFLVVALVLIVVFEAQPFIVSQMICAEKKSECASKAGANAENPKKQDGARGPVAATDKGEAAAKNAQLSFVVSPLGVFAWGNGASDQGVQSSQTATADSASDETDGGGVLLSWFSKVFPALAGIIAPLAATLIAASQKLANLAKTTIGDDTWTTFLKKYSSKIALYLAAFIVPFLLWVAYVYLCYWALLDAPSDGVLVSFFKHPSWVNYCITAVIFALICLALGPNSNSLHTLYKDRLSRAFLFQNSSQADGNTGGPVDKRPFSWLKRRNPPTNGWAPEAAYAPYLLVNTAINLEASKQLNKRGRNADVFIFSPLYIGSRATGYAESTAMEGTLRHLSLATAMATSGAAASANMGDMTIKILTFSLSLLNIRLGYWLANPSKLAAFQSWAARFRSNIGTLYFAAETFGQLDEKKLNVYLTDGGHIENLGVYELLQRRCKVIIAVDAEADPGMTFPSLVHVQLLARIDLGIRIELPWQSLQTSALAVTDKTLYGKDGPPGAMGPHAAIGLIRYDERETGVLFYIKSSLSGDENDYILDYKRRNDSFPHETTVDQFFGEEQFEVYRALGFHAARGLFTGENDFAKPANLSDGFAVEVKKALALLNIPNAMAANIVARLQPAVAATGE